jgi:hypothetical protein
MISDYDKNRRRNRQRALTITTFALSLIAILLIVQMWLLTATLEAFLGGDHDASLPGAIISGLIFFSCAAMYLFVLRTERKDKRQ